MMSCKFRLAAPRAPAAAHRMMSVSSSNASGFDVPVLPLLTLGLTPTSSTFDALPTTRSPCYPSRSDSDTRDQCRGTKATPIHSECRLSPLELSPGRCLHSFGELMPSAASVQPQTGCSRSAPPTGVTELSSSWCQFPLLVCRSVLQISSLGWENGACPGGRVWSVDAVGFLAASTSARVMSLQVHNLYTMLQSVRYLLLSMHREGTTR